MVVFLLTGHRIWHTHMISIEMIRVEQQQFLPFYNIFFFTPHSTAHLKHETTLSYIQPLLVRISLKIFQFSSHSTGPSSNPIYLTIPIEICK